MQEIILGKCEDIIPTLDDNSIDLVVTSPPYNVDLGNNKYNKTPYNLYNDNRDHEDYISWLEDVFRKVYPKIKSGGRVCINIGDGQNGRVPTHSDISYFMSKKLRYLPFTHIIWNKSQIGNRTSWGSWLSPSCPSFPTPFEHIMVFAKESLKLQGEGISDLNSKEFIEWSLSMWTFAPEGRMKDYDHPAMFPVELPKRLIKMLSWKNATVLDPFNGAGTTGVACKMLGRNYIGIELSEEYYKKTLKRLNDTKNDFEIDIFA